MIGTIANNMMMIFYYTMSPDVNYTGSTPCREPRKHQEELQKESTQRADITFVYKTISERNLQATRD